MAIDNGGVSVPIDGNATGFKRAMQEAVQGAKDGARGIESSFAPLKNLFTGIHGQIAAIASVAIGGSMFASMIKETAQFQEESMKLGRALGQSASQASILKVALDANNTSQEEFVSAATALDKQVRKNEAGLNAMGLATRGAGGEIRNQQDLMLDGIAILNTYAAGSDRNIAMQAMMGKGFSMTSNLIDINAKSIKELSELQRELGAVVGAENVEAWRLFDDAGDKAKLTMDAMKMAIGNALIPLLTDLGNWFATIGPDAVAVIKYSFAGFISVIYLAATGVRVLWETINAMVISVAEPIIALGSSISMALNGDWQGASERIRQVGPGIADTWRKAFAAMSKSAQETRDTIDRLFAKGTDSGAPGGGKSAANLIKPAAGAAEKNLPDSYMQYYEAVLEEEKRLAFERDAIRGYTKQEELAYWRFLLENADLKTKDRVAIERKASGLVVEIRRTETRQMMEIATENARSQESLSMGRVGAEAAAAKAMLDTGRITKEQFIRLEFDFERQKYDIQKAALEHRMRLFELDPNTNPVEYAKIKNQMLELDQQYQTKVIQMNGQLLQESMGVFDDLSSRLGGLWNKGLQAMLIGTLEWKNALKAIGAEMVAWFAIDVVGKNVKTWITGEVMKMAASTGFIKQLTATQVAGSVATSAAKTVEVSTVVAANAAEAASGAAASQASIPIIGPELAMAAAGAMLGFVLGFAAMKSAAGGYDIPSGINPVVQAHAEEMILPAPLANVIRGMEKSGSAPTGSAPSAVQLTIHPDALHMSLSSWLEGELARISMGGK